MLILATLRNLMIMVSNNVLTVIAIIGAKLNTRHGTLADIENREQKRQNDME